MTDNESINADRFSLSGKPSQESEDYFNDILRVRSGKHSDPLAAIEEDAIATEFSNTAMRTDVGLERRASIGAIGELGMGVARGGFQMVSGVSNTLEEMAGRDGPGTLSHKMDKWARTHQGGFMGEPDYKGVFDWSASMVGQQVPLMASLLVSGGATGALAKGLQLGVKGTKMLTTAGAMSTMALQTHGDNVDGIRRAAGGRLSEAEIHALGAFSTIIQTSVEVAIGPEAQIANVMSLNAIRKSAVPYAKALAAAKKRGLFTTGKGIAANALIFEPGTEVVQSLTQSVWEDIAAGPGIDMTKEDFTQAFQEGLAAIPASAVFGGISGYAEYRVRSQIIDRQRGIESDKQAILAGRTEEEAALLVEEIDNTFLAFGETLAERFGKDGGAAISDVIKEQAYHWAAETGRNPIDYIAEFQMVFSDTTLTQDQIAAVRALKTPQEHVAWMRKHVQGYRSFESTQRETYRLSAIQRQYEQELERYLSLFGDDFYPEQETLSALLADLQVEDVEQKQAEAEEAKPMLGPDEQAQQAMNRRAQALERLYDLRQKAVEAASNVKLDNRDAYRALVTTTQQSATDMFRSLYDPDENSEWITPARMRNTLANLLYINNQNMSREDAYAIVEQLGDRRIEGSRSELEAAFMLEAAMGEAAKGEDVGHYDNAELSEALRVLKGNDAMWQEIVSFDRMQLQADDTLIADLMEWDELVALAKQSGERRAEALEADAAEFDNLVARSLAYQIERVRENIKRQRALRAAAEDAGATIVQRAEMTLTHAHNMSYRGSTIISAAQRRAGVAEAEGRADVNEIDVYTEQLLDRISELSADLREQMQTAQDNVEMSRLIDELNEAIDELGERVGVVEEGLGKELEESMGFDPEKDQVQPRKKGENLEQTVDRLLVAVDMSFDEIAKHNEELAEKRAELRNLEESQSYLDMNQKWHDLQRKKKQLDENNRAKSDAVADAKAEMGEKFTEADRERVLLDIELELMDEMIDAERRRQGLEGEQAQTEQLKADAEATFIEKAGLPRAVGMFESAKGGEIFAHYDTERKLAVFYANATAEDVLHEWFHHVDLSGLLPESMQRKMDEVYGIRSDMTPEQRRTAMEKAARDFVKYLSVVAETGVKKGVATEYPESMEDTFEYLRAVFAAGLHAEQGIPAGQEMESGGFKIDGELFAKRADEIRSEFPSDLYDKVKWKKHKADESFEEQDIFQVESPELGWSALVMKDGYDQTWHILDLYRTEDGPNPEGMWSSEDTFSKRRPDAALEVVEQAMNEASRARAIREQYDAYKASGLMESGTAPAYDFGKLAEGIEAIHIDGPNAEYREGSRQAVLRILNDEAHRKEIGLEDAVSAVKVHLSAIEGVPEALRGQIVGAVEDSLTPKQQMMFSEDSQYSPELREFFTGAFENATPEGHHQTASKILEQSLRDNPPQTYEFDNPIFESSGASTITDVNQLHEIGHKYSTKGVSAHEHFRRFVAKVAGVKLTEDMSTKPLWDGFTLEQRQQVAQMAMDAVEKAGGDGIHYTKEQLDEVAELISPDSGGWAGLSKAEKESAMKSLASLFRAQNSEHLREVAKTQKAEELQRLADRALAEFIREAEAQARVNPGQRVKGTGGEKVARMDGLIGELSKKTKRFGAWIQAKTSDFFAMIDYLDDGREAGPYKKLLVDPIRRCVQDWAKARHETEGWLVEDGDKHGAHPEVHEWSDQYYFGEEGVQLSVSEALYIYMYTDRGRAKAEMEALAGSNKIKIGNDLRSVIRDVITFVEGRGKNGFVRYVQQKGPNDYRYSKHQKSGFTKTTPLLNWAKTQMDYMKRIYPLLDAAHFERTGNHLGNLFMDKNGKTHEYIAPSMRIGQNWAHGYGLTDMFVVDEDARANLVSSMFANKYGSEVTLDMLTTEEQMEVFAEEEAAYSAERGIKGRRQDGRSQKVGATERRSRGFVGAELMMDAPFIFNTYQEQADIYRTKYKTLDYLDNITRQESFRQTLRKTVGDQRLDIIHNALREMIERERFAGGRAYVDNDFDRWVRHVQGRVMPAILGARASSMAMQAASGPRVLAEIPMRDSIKFLSNAAKVMAQVGGNGHRLVDALMMRHNPLQGDTEVGRWFKHMFDASPDIIRRMIGPDVQDFYASAQRRTGPAAMKVGRATLTEVQMGGFRVMDMATVLTAYHTAYDSKVAELKRKARDGGQRLSDEQIEAKAVEFAEHVVNMTQPASTTTDRNLLQTSRPTVRMWFPFTGDRMKQFTYINRQIIAPLARGWRDNNAMGVLEAMTTRKYGDQPAAKRILFMGLLPMTIVSLIKRRRPPEDWEEWREDMLGLSVSTIPLIGPIFQNALTSNYEIDGTPVALMPVMASAKAMRSLKKDGLFDDEGYLNEYGVEQFARAAFTHEGLPVVGIDFIKEMAKMMIDSDAFEPDERTSLEKVLSAISLEVAEPPDRDD